MPSSGPRGAPFSRRGPARARRPDPAGTGRPGGIRRFARHGGVEPPSTVLETVGLPDLFGPFRRTELRNRPESRRLMTRHHPGFYRSCRTDETGLTRIKPPVVEIPCTGG